MRIVPFDKHRRPLIPRLIFAALLISSAVLGGVAARSNTAPMKTEILWDTWGVPHIFAKNDEELFHAFGWAQAQSHGDLILRLYGQARGRAAEYWGASYLDSDRWALTNSIPGRAKIWYGQQNPAFKRMLDAFARGVNDYARAHADKITDEVEAVLPIDGVDILAHSQRVIHYHFVTRPEVAGAAGRALAPQGGSNTWAVAPKRSASGKTLLLANPHLPWSDFFLFYEAQLVSPSIDAYGATLVGFPGLGIAFNDYLGWSHTVNTHDGMDLFELKLAEGGYLWDGKTQAFETETRTIKVKAGDGGIGDEKLTIRRSAHGPVIAEKGDRAVALRVAGIDDARLLEQWWEMGRAKNLKEFETAIRQLQIPMFTIMYADRDGHIMHFFGGRTPVRAAGNYNWAGIVPGNTSATLWTRTHPFEELPRVIDPASGWLQNANDPPWTTTFPLALDPNKFPSYMAPRSMHFRAQRSARMLDEDESITFEEFIDDKHSSHMELADRTVDELIAAAQKSENSEAKRAAAVLAKWDRTANATSRGGVLFQAFTREFIMRAGQKRFAVRWSESDPRMTPRGLGDPQLAVEVLASASAKVTADYGAPDVTWGEVYRLRVDGYDLPANGGPGELGIFRVVNYAPDKDKRFRAEGGDSYVAAIEFSTPVRARTLMSYGNASQPGSPHRTDQLPLFARQELRPVWRTRGEIEKNLRGRQAF